MIPTGSCMTDWTLRSASLSWSDETDACCSASCNRSMYWPSVRAAAPWSANPLMERGRTMCWWLTAPLAALNLLKTKNNNSKFRADFPQFFSTKTNEIRRIFGWFESGRKPRLLHDLPPPPIAFFSPKKNKSYRYWQTRSASAVIAETKLNTENTFDVIGIRTALVRVCLSAGSSRQTIARGIGYQRTGRMIWTCVCVQVEHAHLSVLISL